MLIMNEKPEINERPKKFLIIWTKDENKIKIIIAINNNNLTWKYIKKTNKKLKDRANKKLL